jgi:site-specific DNA recombinase
MSKRTVIYARVSTDEQAERGTSLQTQVEGCQRYATAQGFDVVAVLVDAASGAIPIVERPQGKELYKLVDAGQVDAVLLFTHDRTARDEKVIEYLLFKAHLHERGVELHYSDNGLDPYTMEGNLVGYIKSHAAADERRKIAERNKRGRLAKASAGKWVIHNSPYGYRKVGKSKDAYLEIDECTAQVVKRVFDLYIGKAGAKGLNAMNIAALLTGEGVPSPKAYRNHRNGWTASTVLCLTKNRQYIGEFRYKDIDVPLPKLAIIDRAVFDAAQEQRGKNLLNSPRCKQFEYLLAGMIRCTCGRGMMGASSRQPDKIRLYYRCNDRELHLRQCKAKGIRADIIDARVWEWVSALLADDAFLDAGIRRMIERNTDEQAPRRTRLGEVEKAIGNTAGQVKRLAGALVGAAVEEVAAAIQMELNEAGKRLAALKNERGLLEMQIAQSELSEQEIAAIVRFAADVRDEVVTADFETKRFLLDKLRFSAQLVENENGRFLAVACRLTAEPSNLSLSYCNSRTSYNQSNQCTDFAAGWQFDPGYPIGREY